MNKSKREEIDRNEDLLIEDFRSHSLLKEIKDVDRDKLQKILIQRRFMSYIFTNAYDMSIDGLYDESAKKRLRSILRDEYPDQSGSTPSHREDLLQDLVTIGIGKPTLLKSEPSNETREIIDATISLIRHLYDSEHSDLAIVTFIRFWGEVLVAVEYKILWERIKKYFSGKPSRFYSPHLVHDQKRKPIFDFIDGAETHADNLARYIANYLNFASENEQELLAKVKVFEDTEKEVCKLKRRFYDQFI
jgi:hypothetical protein